MENEIHAIVTGWKKPRISDEVLNLIGEIQTTWAEFKQPTVKDNDGYQVAANNRKALKIYSKQLEETRKEFIKPIDALRDAVQAAFMKPKGTLDSILRTIDKAMLDYDAELQREREKKQRELEEFVRKQAEAERAKLEVAALKALQQGNEAKAEALVVKAEEVREVVPILAPVKAIAKGAGVKPILKYRVIDPNAVDRSLCEPSPAKMWKMVQIVGVGGKLAGIEIWEEKTISGTR